MSPVSGYSNLERGEQLYARDVDSSPIHNPGVQAAIAVGILAFLMIVLAFIYFFRHGRQSQQPVHDDMAARRMAGAGWSSDGRTTPNMTMMMARSSSDLLADEISKTWRAQSKAEHIIVDLTPSSTKNNIPAPSPAYSSSSNRSPSASPPQTIQRLPRLQTTTSTPIVSAFTPTTTHSAPVSKPRRCHHPPSASQSPPTRRNPPTPLTPPSTHGTSTSLTSLGAGASGPFPAYILSHTNEIEDGEHSPAVASSAVQSSANRGIRALTTANPDFGEEKEDDAKKVRSVARV